MKLGSLFIGIILVMVGLLVLMAAIESMFSGHEKLNHKWAYIGSDLNLLIVSLVVTAIGALLISLHRRKKGRG